MNSIRALSRTSFGLPVLGVLVATLALQAHVQAQVVYLTSTFDGQQETPPNSSPGTGTGCFELDFQAGTLSYNIQFSGLSAAESAAHIHGFAPPGTPAPVLYPLPLGSPKVGTIAVTASEAQSIFDGLTYVNIHSTLFPGGEIRGQILRAPSPNLFCFGDGSSGGCPCGNNSIPGSGEGCRNSTLQGGTLAPSGFASIVCDTLNLTGTGMPAFSTTVYIQGTAQVTPVVFGDGLRCIGNTLTRLAVVPNVGGSSHVPAAGTPPISQLGGITTPGTYFYQTYYRDPDLTFCPAPPGNSFNITNAVKAVWVP
jgi:hypothetical protein